MALITYERVKAAAGVSGDMTAAEIAAALGTYFGAAVRTSYEKGVNKCYDKYGWALTQGVDVVRTEYVGLDEDLAERLAALYSDNTAVYRWSAVFRATYSTAYSGIDYDIVEVIGGPTNGTMSWTFKPGGVGSGISRDTAPRITDGTIVTATASRVDDGGCWAVTVTATTYHCPADNSSSIFWPQVPPPSGTGYNNGAGVESSKGTRAQFLFSYSGYPLIETTLTAVAEFKHVSDVKVGSGASAHSPLDDLIALATDATWRKAQYKSGGSVEFTMAVRSGTAVTVDARFVEESGDWTVTKTSTTYSHNFVSSGTGWYDGGAV